MTFTDDTFPVDNSSSAGYVFDTAQEIEKQRLEAQTALWDPFTFARLGETGLGEGWRCLEIGGGTGSVASWMHAKVGKSGHVVVTDLETRWLEPMAAANLEVRRHDVVADPIEESSFDLIHARMVLMHLPQREAVLAKLAAALRPGGWLVVHDVDLHSLSVAHPAHPTWLKFAKACSIAIESAGADAGYGLKLPAVLGETGLGEVQAQGIVLPRRAPDVAGAVLPLVGRLRERIISAGLATATELDQVTAEFNDDESTLWIYPPIMVSARGRRASSSAELGRF